MAKEKYEIISAERYRIIRGLSINEKNYFASSALVSRLTLNTQIMQETDFCSSTISCLKIQYEKGIALIQKPVEILKISLKPVALIGAGMAMYQGINIFWEYWLPNSLSILQLTDASTGTLITFYTIKELLHVAKAVKEYGAPKASLTTVSNFSLASVSAVVPAGFSALVGVILGIQYVDDSESSQKWKALMVPYAIDTFFSGHGHFKNKLHSFQTAAITTIPEYTKECVLEYTPECVKKGVGYLKEGILNNTSQRIKDFMSNSFTFLSEYTTPFYQGKWLWKWHHDFDEEVGDNDSVTNASFYFSTFDENSSDSEENVDYYEAYENSMRQSEGFEKGNEL